jgi:outer membrane protein OmpA-like peptidoglycan-associated protein
VQDPVDACPDQPGAPNPDPKKNGCPGLVSVTGGQIVIVKPVFFATNKDVILKKSFEVLQSVADALKASPQIKKVRVEGHTDDRGKVAYNTELSDRRAKSVMKWLVEHGIEEGRLAAQGFGPAKPIADNKTADGRAKNRRVDFVIVDPPQDKSVQTVDAKSVEVPSSPDQSDKSSGKAGKKGKVAKPAPSTGKKGKQPAKSKK